MNLSLTPVLFACSLFCVFVAPVGWLWCLRGLSKEIKSKSMEGFQLRIMGFIFLLACTFGVWVVGAGLPKSAANWIFYVALYGINIIFISYSTWSIFNLQGMVKANIDNNSSA